MIVNTLKRVSAVLFLLLMAAQARAEIELPWLLSDGAVLQRDEPVPIWGTAPAGENVIVRFGAEQQQVQADADGNWRTVFPARKAGESYDLTVSAGEFSRTVKDLLMGDVWVTSGQSNMEWVVRDSDGATAEIAAAKHPQIRHFKVPRSWAVEPSSSLAGGEWHPATPDHLGDFTAVGWYFAKRIHAETGVPIGLINSTWGGSRIEAWMSPAALGTTAEAAQEKVGALAEAGEARANAVRRALRRWSGALVEQPTAGQADWSQIRLSEWDWMKIQVPDLWEEQQFAGVDGVVWYRHTFKLSRAEAAQGITLNLGRIDDNDITWVNGQKVGATNGYDVERRYKIPAEILKAGRNQIAIRVEDNGGGGGIYSSNEEDIHVETTEGKRRPLAGEWKIKADKVTVAILDSVHHTDTALYNKMLHPLFQIPVKGVLWYQGEANANSLAEAEIYKQQFPALINDWRAHWNKPELAFYWVQLANFISGGDTPSASPWAVLRDSQTAALALKNTGQAITIDIGNPKDIHPTDKTTVGERLALIARNKTYGESNIEYRGPVFHRVQRQDGRLIISFNTKKKLVGKNAQTAINGFEIATADGHFKPVTASIANNQVTISIPESETLTAVRYAWSDNPEAANLMDDSGLPAEPFRTEF